MSLFTVKNLKPNRVVQVGWTHPAYWYAVYEHEDDVPLMADAELVTLYDLIEATRTEVDWDRERETLLHLRDDPWMERARATGRRGAASPLAMAFGHVA